METCGSGIKPFLFSSIENVRRVAPRLDIHHQVVRPTQTKTFVCS
jgi:hypothetical protein